MFSISHAITGAVVYMAIFGWRLDAAIFGAVFGSLPDTSDWIVWKLGLAERWGVVYNWWHRTWGGLILSALLIAPLPHILFDKFVHWPFIHKLEPYMVEKVVGKYTRYQVWWFFGEIANFFFTLSVLLFKLLLES